MEELRLFKSGTPSIYGWESVSDQFVEAFGVFYKTEDKTQIVHLVDKVLEPYGGRLFDGFSLGEEQE